MASGPGGAPVPGEVQMQADVTLCLVQAMVERLGIDAADINGETNPSKPPIGADGQGWGICLATYAVKIRALRPVYAAYQHYPVYTQETLEKKFSQTVPYLSGKLRRQITTGQP